MGGTGPSWVIDNYIDPRQLLSTISQDEPNPAPSAGEPTSTNLILHPSTTHQFEPLAAEEPNSSSNLRGVLYPVAPAGDMDDSMWDMCVWDSDGEDEQKGKEGDRGC